MYNSSESTSSYLRMMEDARKREYQRILHGVDNPRVYYDSYERSYAAYNQPLSLELENSNINNKNNLLLLL